MSFRLVGAQDPQKIRAAFHSFVRARLPADAKVEFKSFAGAPATELPYDNPMLAKWRPWVDMQEKYFKNDLIKPVLVTDWDDMKKPYLLEVMGSGILVDMVFDAVKGMPSPEAAAKAQKRVEELLVQSGYLKK